MTTSKTLHNHLIALSQQGRRRKHKERKHQLKKHNGSSRFVALAKVVLQSASGMGHHYCGAAPSAPAPVEEQSISAKSKKGPKVNEEATKKVPTSTTAAAEEEPSKDNDNKDTGNTDVYYLQHRARLNREIQDLEDRRVQVRQKQTEFWGTYKYALEKVSNLNDLRDAPDAILPGNLIERPPPPPPPLVVATLSSEPVAAAAAAPVPDTDAKQGTTEEVSAQI